jgi:hypothetical protein
LQWQPAKIIGGLLVELSVGMLYVQVLLLLVGEQLLEK